MAYTRYSRKKTGFKKVLSIAVPILAIIGLIVLVKKMLHKQAHAAAAAAVGE